MEISFLMSYLPLINDSQAIIDTFIEIILVPVLELELFHIQLEVLSIKSENSQ